MHTNISDVSMKPIKVKSEAKMLSTPRQLSRQASMSNSSNEVYYGDSSVSIPFRWESQPGTPKVNFRERLPLPPLTPPPSYQGSPARKSISKHSDSNSSGILHTVLPKLNLIKKINIVQSSSSPSLSSSSSSSSSPWSSSSPSVIRSSPFSAKSAEGQQRRRLLFRPRRKDEDDEEDEQESQASSFCFGAGRNSSNVGPRGCPASVIKLLLGQYA